MYKKFQPATTEAFPLGTVNNKAFEIVPSRKSCFDGMEEVTPLPALHLIVASVGDTVTWETWRSIGGSTGTLIDLVQTRKDEIIRYFFGNALAPEDAAIPMELNDGLSATRKTVHFHVKAAHRMFFGDNGVARRAVDSILKPLIIEERAIERAQATARGMMESTGGETPDTTGGTGDSPRS